MKKFLQYSLIFIISLVFLLTLYFELYVHPKKKIEHSFNEEKLYEFDYDLICDGLMFKPDQILGDTCYADYGKIVLIKNKLIVNDDRIYTISTREENMGRYVLYCENHLGRRYVAIFTFKDKMALTLITESDVDTGGESYIVRGYSIVEVK